MPQSGKNKQSFSDLRKNLQDLKKSFEEIEGKERHVHNSLSNDNVYI